MTHLDPALDLRASRTDPVPDELAELERTWRSPPGFFAWFTHVSHTNIGQRFLITAFVFFVLSGLLALGLRLQLLAPLNDLVSPETYNQMMTVHGTAMMFLFAIPAVEGVASEQIARDCRARNSVDHQHRERLAIPPDTRNCGRFVF